MLKLAELSQDELKYICERLQLPDVRRYFQNNPKDFAKIRPGFRAERLSDADTLSILVKNASITYSIFMCKQYYRNIAYYQARHENYLHNNLEYVVLECMAYLLKGDTKREAADKQKWQSFESLVKMMWVLADCFEENDDRPAALAELKRVYSLFDALADEDVIQNFRRVYLDDLNDRITRLTN